MKGLNLNTFSAINAKIILAFVVLMLVTNVLVLGVYGHFNKAAESKVNQDLVIRQVMSLIQTVRNTEPQRRKKVVDKIYLPNLKAALDNNSKYTPKFKNVTLWHIVQNMQSQTNTMQFSLELEPDSWLNISASVGPASWRMLSLLIGLQLAFAVAIIFYIWGTHKFTIPLKNFTKAAERLGMDLNAKPLQEYGTGIVRDTASAINRMQQRISDLLHERTRMLAAISHDLRTPITRLKLRSQFIEDETIQSKMLSDLDDMEVMVNETMHFAGNDHLREKKSRLDLNALLHSVCTNLVDTRLEVSYKGPLDRIPFFGRSLALKRAFSNLIENAVKYGDAAKVYLRRDNKGITLLILDNGPGIPPDECEAVFAPFYRGEGSRSRDTGGIGLGLAVTRDIIHAHEGTIHLEANTPNGLKVIVRFNHPAR